MQKQALESRKKARTEDQFRWLFEQAPLAYQFLDPTGKITKVNAAWCQLLGYTQEEAQGRSFGDFLHPEQQALFQERFIQYKALGNVSREMFEVITYSGEILSVEMQGQIGFDAQGAIRQVHCILTDLSERKTAEQDRQQLYNALFENNLEVTLLIDPETLAYVAANPAACAYYGYSAEQFIQMPVAQINILPEDEIARQMADAQSMQQRTFSFRHRLASGEVRDVVLTIAPIQFNGQALLYSTVHDVTHLKQMEAEAERLNAALRQRLIALSQPLEETSHLKFEDLFNLEEIQAIQDAFASAAGVASVITDPQGRPITRPSNFSGLCNEIIRRRPSGAPDCMLMDCADSDYSAIRSCLKSGLMHVSAHITLGDQTIANWLIGQVYDLSADPEPISWLAQQSGLDEAQFTAAFNAVTRLPAEQFDKIAQVLGLVARQLSTLAVQNIQQARTIVEREQANTKLARANRLYAILSTISQAAVSAHTPGELFDLACQGLVERGLFRLAWIGGLEHDSQQILPLTWAGEELGYLSNIKISAEQTPEGSGPAGCSVREKCLVFCNNIAEDVRMGVWKEEALRRGYAACASFPLFIGEQVFGAMAVYSEEVGFFTEEENNLLNKISTTLSFALDAYEKESRRREAEEALRRSEEKYHRLFDSANDAIFTYPILPGGQLGTFNEVNQAACTRLGFSAEELLRLSPQQIKPPELQPNLGGLVRQLGQEKKLLVETMHLTKDGRRIPVEVNVRLFDDRGQLTALSIARDITERKRAEEQIQHQVKRLSGLRQIDAAINTNQSLPEVMDVILEQVTHLLGVGAADVLIYNAENNLLQMGCSRGFKTRPAREALVPLGESLAGWIATQQTCYKVSGIAGNQRFTRAAFMQAEGLSDYCGAALVSKGKILGVLEVFNARALPDEQEWMDYFQTLAGQAAIAIDAAKMLEGLRDSHQALVKAYDETIEGWSHALDLRDHETEGHSQRVTELSVRLGRVLGLRDEELAHLRRGALLHDIGKVGVPDQILLKPAALSVEEWVVMQQHPQYAFDLLSPIDFLTPALDIPYFHHEKWDGSGYPRGLKGEEIPLPARIFAIVDVWDALRSDRPYRKAWSVEKSIAYIREQAGKHFDPALIPVFLKLIGGSGRD